MYVVGATKAEYLGDIRKIIPDSFILVPGVGAQGGNLQDVCKYGMNDQVGLLINSSRGIIYASQNADFAEKAREAAKALQQQMAAILDAKEIRRVVNFRRRTDLEFRSQSLEQLRNNLDLKQIPFRIEAFDISNLGAEYRAGSMVVMDDGICKPSMYRKFHIKSFTGQDDFKSMEEVLFRRLKRLIKP